MSLYEKFLIQTYNIGVINKSIGNVINKGLEKGDITWLKHAYKDRYFADPFLIKEDDKFFYILAEEYLFWEEKGKIVLLTVKREDFSLASRKIVIEELTHLSFPFCELNGNTIIPESVKSGKTKCYSFDTNTMSVTGCKVILNEGLIDAAFYNDGKDEWILTAKIDNPKVDMYMYQKKEGTYIPVNQGKVVKSSIEETRSAGRLFEYEGKLYRPVQDSTGRYGRQTRIMQVSELSAAGYNAKCVQIIDGRDNPPFNETLHTFNVYNHCIIVDGSKDYCRFPMKIFYKKFRWMFKET